MARISARDFIGTRARFQRLRDAKIFNGWIEQFYGSGLTVSTSTDSPMEIGDEFRVEGFGNHISVVFNAKLETVGAFDVLSAGGFQTIEGSNARILEARRTTLNLQVTSPVRYSASPEAVRYMVPDLFTQVTANDMLQEGFTVDVASNGIGVLLRCQLEPGSSAEVQIDTNLGPVKGLALVRYCRADKEREGLFRCGLMFTEMGRIERPRWDRFIRELN